MANSVIEDFKSKMRNGNPITRLIIINVVIFLLVSIFRIITFLSGESVLLVTIETFTQNNLSLPVSFHGILYKPWTLITYMFTHFALMHMFWNMITLYWFGQILIEYTNSKKLIAHHFCCFYIRAWLRKHLIIVRLVIMRAFTDACSKSPVPPGDGDRSTPSWR